MERIQKLIEKEHRFKNTIQNRVIDRTTKSLKEKQALIQLLDKEYKVDNFLTMKTGFEPNQIETKYDARHYIIETRIFNSGFNTKSMKPEIRRQLRKLDPNRKYRLFKRKLLEENRCKNIEINRAISNTAFTKMLKDKHNWILYNRPSKHKLFDADEDKLSDIKPPDEVQKDGEQGTDLVKKETSSEVIKKETVLEKRLPRRPADAFSMTMRTLGPVYFQSSAQQQQKPEVEIQDYPK